MAGRLLTDIQAPPLLPDWLEEYRIPDAAFLSAYDQSSPEYRASLKSALALHFYSMTRQDRIERAERIIPGKGFREIASVAPVPWAAIIFPGDYSAAARLFSVAVQSLLAGCGVSIALCLGVSPRPSALTALELCGFENAFAVSRAKAVRAIKELVQNADSGRIIILGPEKMSELVDDIRAVDAGLWLERDNYPLALTDPDKFSSPLLELAQGSAPPVSAGARIYALYSDQPEDRIVFNYTLLIRPGLECFWKFQDLPEEFFLNRVCSYSLI
ncbi:MAG: hypothetical protein K2H64_12010 [Desulfovibrio sp.]|nr:hypothetical protein [Desulfovibrio sp.]